jgi:hypothetical protein
MESGTAKGSPTRRNIEGTAERKARLEAFAKAGQAPILPADQMRNVVGGDLWDGYWARLDAIKDLMEKAQSDAEKISAILEAEFERRSPEISN